MTKIQYNNDPFSDNGLKWLTNKESPREAIEIANKILSDYDDDGYTLTLRQLYYQFVSQGITSENTERAYKNLGNLITKARNNGLLSWYGIEDRGRSLSGLYRHEEDDRQVVYGLEGLLSLDFWKRQETYIEVWVEKNALIRVVGKACDPLKIPFMACKGYLSASEAWRAGRRFMRKRDEGKNCVMIHLGDHDPEGLDMTRDNEARLLKYSEGYVDVQRIALNMDQIQQYNPPPNYAKASSSRFDKYVDEFGEECWELDALEPKVIVDLIERAIEPYIDRDIWNAVEEEETQKRHHLEMLHTHWEDVKTYMDDLEEEGY